MRTAWLAKGLPIGGGALCGILIGSTAYAVIVFPAIWSGGIPPAQPSVRILFGYLLLVVPCILNGAVAAWESSRSNSQRFFTIAALPLLVVIMSLPFGHGAVWTSWLVATLALIAGRLAQTVGLRLRARAPDAAA